MMLFRFTATTNDYDQYDGLVVAAISEEAARKVVADKLEETMLASRGKQTVDSFKVERLRVRDLKTGIVLANFTAG